MINLIKGLKLKNESSIRKRQKIVVLVRSEEQKAEAKKRCRRLCQNFKSLGWIIDNESIFTFSNSSSNRNSKFDTSNIRLTPEDVKYRKKEEV